MLMYVRRLIKYQNSLLSPFLGFSKIFIFSIFGFFFQTAILRTCAERIHQPECFSASCYIPQSYLESVIAGPPFHDLHIKIRNKCPQKMDNYGIYILSPHFSKVFRGQKLTITDCRQFSHIKKLYYRIFYYGF